jgi:hypothetical protein
MWPYWMMYLLPAATALLAGAPRRPGESLPLRGGWAIAWLALVLMIGYRYQVGGDWNNYLRNQEGIRYLQLSEVLLRGDVAYELLSWLSAQQGWGIYGVNLISAAIFTTGLLVFSRSLPRPWLALAVAMPYTVLVLGMGYTRQGVALGLVMLGLAALQRQRTAWFVAAVLVGALFHSSAVVVIPLAALAATRRLAFTAAWVGLVAWLAYDLLVADRVAGFFQSYVEAQYQSEGAFVRLSMNVVPAVLLLWRFERFGFSRDEGRLWRVLAILSLVLFALYYLSPSSTAVDRIALYALPLQLAVFTRLPDVLGGPQRTNQDWVVVVALYYATVLFVWLNYAVHAFAWIPYRFYPLEFLW